MSWFARSIANTLKFDDDNDDVVAGSKQQTDDYDPSSSPLSPSRGVKEDISELSKTLTRQFWGVASFLAPPPQSDRNLEPVRDPDEEGSDPAGITGFRTDFAEIGGRIKSGISKLSNNIPVSEITKMASGLLQLGPEEEEKTFDSGNGAVGVTDEVVTFVRDIAMHPGTWLDFPLPDEEHDEDFNLTDAQQEHALAVERLAPRLAALRIELCPGYMSEARFWEIYFVLLHPRLDKQDAELLSTPQVVKARASLAQKLHKRTKPIEEDWSEETFQSADRTDPQHEQSLSVPSTVLSADVAQERSGVESATSTAVAVPGTKAHPVISEIQTSIKPEVEEEHITYSKDKQQQSPSTIKLEESDEDGDDWLKEETTEVVGASKTSLPIENEEDVSFSDLEEDDSDVPTNFKKVNYSSDKDSRDWVQLRKSFTDLSTDTNSITQIGSDKGKNDHSKESNDWLDVDDIEVA